MRWLPVASDKSHFAPPVERLLNAPFNLASVLKSGQKQHAKRLLALCLVPAHTQCRDYLAISGLTPKPKAGHTGSVRSL